MILDQTTDDVTPMLLYQSGPWWSYITGEAAVAPTGQIAVGAMGCWIPGQYAAKGAWVPGSDSPKGAFVPTGEKGAGFDA